MCSGWRPTPGRRSGRLTGSGCRSGGRSSPRRWAYTWRSGARRTMSTARPIDVRCARDRLIDLLGLGETTPIRDVNVQEAQLTVNVGAPCEITIDPAQSGVRYELFDGDAAVVPACAVDGAGEKAILE